MEDENRILLKPLKSKKRVNQTHIVQHADLDDYERKALYKFFEDNPEEILGGKERKKGRVKKKCRCK